MSHGIDQTSPAMQQAIELIRQGKNADAEELLRRSLRLAEERAGPGSHACAVAHNDLGTLLSFLGDPKRACSHYRQACAGPLPTETQALRDRLTHLLNLAATLETLGDLNDAEAAYRQGVAGRARFYGREHPGHAFGQEPLAALLLHKGRHQEALNLLEEVVDNFRHNGHPRIATALALRAEALKAVGSTRPPFAGLDALPEELIVEMAGKVQERRSIDPVRSRAVLADLLPLIEQRFGPDHAHTRNVLTTIANHEAEQGEDCNHDVRLDATRKVLASLRRTGQKEQALHVRQGLALALNVAGRDDEALTVYREALEEALGTDDRGLISQIRRNYGLFLIDRGRLPEGEGELRLAVEAAEAAEDLDRWGRGEAALGVFLMHRQRPDEARPFLERALTHLDPSHADSVCARHHLNALVQGQACSCGDQMGALLEQLRAYIWKQVPRGLLTEVELSVQENDLSVGVHLAREASEEEVERLQILINQAILAFKKQVGRRS
jgi:tetratricopeptide (TPR) repeat protein